MRMPFVLNSHFMSCTFYFILITLLLKGGLSMDMKKIGSFLKILRKEKGLTQEQLAEKLGVAGRTVSRWETASNMVKQIGSTWNTAIIGDILYEYRKVFIVFTLGMIIHWLPSKFKQWYRINFAFLPKWIQLLAVVLTVFVIYQFITAELQSFIYFQF